MNKNCFFAFVVVMGCGQAWAATRTVTLDALPAIELVREGETASLRAEGLERPLEPVGAPSLPYYTVSLEVTAGAEVGAITLEGEWQTLAEGVTLEPIQPVYVISETPETVGPDPALYAKAWPEAAVENLGITRSLGKRTLHLKVTPVRYAGGKVEVLTQGSVSVEVTEPAATPRLKSASLLTAENEATTPPARRYILISPPAYTSQWQDYLDERQTQRSDVTFVLKNAADIYSAYPFNPDNTDGSPRNPAESIHQFLREDVAANPAGTTYVVLGGSWVNAWNITSADDTTLQTKIPGIIAKPTQLYSHYPLTDMFYACLDVDTGKYPWDGNANKNYADSSELGNTANDYNPDIVVSRIPLRSSKLSEAAVITAFTEKVRRAEAENFSGRHRYYSAGGQLDTTYSASNGNFLRAEQEFYDGGLNQFDPTRSSSFVDCEVVPRRSLKNMLSTRRPVLGGNPLFPTSWSAAYATQNEAVTDFFSEDREYTEYRDHGSSTYLYGGLVTADRHLNGSGLSRIILAGYSCMTGYIDGEKLTLAESEIVSQSGGAVASVHNSRFGLSYAGKGASDEDGLSSTLQYRIKQQLMTSDCDLGTAWLNTRKGYCSNTGGQQRFVMMEQLLLGDPLIALPPAVGAATWTGSEDCSQDLGYTSLTATAGTTIESAKLVKVMQGLTVTGAGNFTFAADGGVGSGVTFSETGTHTLTLASPSKGYFAQPTNAKEVAITGSGITLDLGSTAPTFTKLTLNGGDTRKTGNIIRGTTEGQLTRFLPLTVENTEILFATRDAFLRKANDVVQTVETDKITVTNGSVGFFTNPNVGLAYGRWDGFYCPVELNSGSIHVKSTQTAAFGHSAKPGLAVSVTGDSSVKTTGGGKITLFGTTTFTVEANATLTLNANFATSSLENSELVIDNRGTVVVDGDSGLTGEVTINGGTLELKALPLKNVTKLTLTGTVKLILPKDEGGFYQILPVGATLEKTGTVTVYASDNTETALTGEFTSTNAFFDKSAFLTWNTASGNWNTTESNKPWLLNGIESAYTAGAKAYFPDVESAATVSVNLTEEVACDFVNFGNAASTYTFSGSRLNIKNLQLGTPVTFSNTVQATSGTLVTGGTSAFTSLFTPSISVADGATISVETLSNTITTIKGLRFYPRKMKTGGGVCSLAEMRFYAANGTEVPLSAATATDAPGYTSSNVSYLWDGIVYGGTLYNNDMVWQVTATADIFANAGYYLQFIFNSEQPMVATYKLANGFASYNNAPTSFRVDVTPDGETWVTVSDVTGAITRGQGFVDLWYQSNPFSCTANPAPTAVTVSAGGAYGLKGTPKAKITCEAGAIFKAVQGSALQYTTNCTFVYPEEGTVTIDPAALGLADGASAQVIANSGKTFTHADLAHFSAPEGYNLMRTESGLNVVKQSTLAGPYRRTLSGRATWAKTGWTADTVTEGGTWLSANRQPCADIELLTTADTVLKITESVSFGTLRQQVLPEGTEGSEVDRSAYANRLRLEKSAGATVEAVAYDLSAFEGRVTIAFSTGDATVIAGADTRLRESGTGKLVIGEGMKVTLYAASWGGTIENNGGTIEYRSPMKAPQVQFK